MNLLKQSYTQYGLVMAGIVALWLLYMELTGNNESFEKALFVKE